jgi:hypothetical protein
MLTSTDLTLILRLIDESRTSEDLSDLKQKIYQQLLSSVSYDLECG